MTIVDYARALNCDLTITLTKTADWAWRATIPELEVRVKDSWVQEGGYGGSPEDALETLRNLLTDQLVRVRGVEMDSPREFMWEKLP